MVVFPAFALPIIRTRNWTFGIRRRGCCVPVSIEATTEEVSTTEEALTTEEVSTIEEMSTTEEASATEEVSIGTTTEDGGKGR